MSSSGIPCCSKLNVSNDFSLLRYKMQERVEKALRSRGSLLFSKCFKDLVLISSFHPPIHLIILQGSLFLTFVVRFTLHKNIEGYEVVGRPKCRTNKRKQANKFRTCATKPNDNSSMSNMTHLKLTTI